MQLNPSLELASTSCCHCMAWPQTTASTESRIAATGACKQDQGGCNTVMWRCGYARVAAAPSAQRCSWLQVWAVGACSCWPCVEQTTCDKLLAPALLIPFRKADGLHTAFHPSHTRVLPCAAACRHVQGMQASSASHPSVIHQVLLRVQRLPGLWTATQPCGASGPCLRTS